MADIHAKLHLSAFPRAHEWTICTISLRALSNQCTLIFSLLMKCLKLNRLHLLVDVLHYLSKTALPIYFHSIIFTDFISPYLYLTRSWVSWANSQLRKSPPVYLRRWTRAGKSCVTCWLAIVFSLPWQRLLIGYTLRSTIFASTTLKTKSQNMAIGYCTWSNYYV